jgi:hypothetical protein
MQRAAMTLFDGVPTLEHASSPTFFGGFGRVLRIETDGTRSLMIDGRIRPTSILVDSDGTVYVTNRGVSIGTGEVVADRAGMSSTG